MTDRKTIYEAIDEECAYQDAKYGTPEEREISILEYLYILRAEQREAHSDAMAGNGPAALCELLQAVTVGVRCLEYHGVVTRAQLETGKVAAR